MALCGSLWPPNAVSRPQIASIDRAGTPNLLLDRRERRAVLGRRASLPCAASRAMVGSLHVVRRRLDELGLRGGGRSGRPGSTRSGSDRSGSSPRVAASKVGARDAERSAPPATAPRASFWNAASARAQRHRQQRRSQQMARRAARMRPLMHLVSWTGWLMPIDQGDADRRQDERPVDDACHITPASVEVVRCRPEAAGLR